MITELSVAICIATFRRPKLLRDLLHSLESLQFRTIPEPAISLVIVDNDPHGSARPVVAKYLSRRFPIRYYVEHRAGISHARNTAIENARGADYVAFLDDDEKTSPQWLEQLLAVQSAYRAPIVAGRVNPVFEGHAPEWVAANYLHSRNLHTTGERVRSAGAGNVLISAAVLQAMSPHWFDPRFAFTGGEDTHFFRRCLARGFPIVWADDAVVYETVPQARLHPDYLCARARSGANHWTRIELELRPTLPNMASRFAVGLYRVAQGSTVSVASPALPRHQVLRGKLLLAEGIGNLNAFFGRTYSLYGSTTSNSHEP